MASAGSARSKCGRWVDVWSHPVVESLLGHADRGAFYITRVYAYSVPITKKAPENRRGICFRVQRYTYFIW